MTKADDKPIPSLDYLASHVGDAYEASFRVTQGENAPEIAFDAQTILNLLHFALKNPEEYDLSPAFGVLTSEALVNLLARVDRSKLTTTKPKLTSRERDHARAIEIGHELLALEKSLEQGRIAYGNAYNPANWIHSFLFEGLSHRREKLRAELLGLFA